MKTETAITNLKTIADNLKYECSRQELRGYANSIKKYIDAIEENLASDVNTGAGQLTIPDVMCSQSDEDAMIDWHMSQQPILTPEETMQEIEKLNKCADYILKTGITPNLDSIY